MNEILWIVLISFFKFQNVTAIDMCIESLPAGTSKRGGDVYRPAIRIIFDIKASGTL